jgi:hypothetical protein
MHAALAAAMSSGAWDETPRRLQPNTPEIHVIDKSVIGDVLASSIKLSDEQSSTETPMTQAALAAVHDMLAHSGVPMEMQSTMMSTIHEACVQSNKEAQSRATQIMADNMRGMLEPVITCANSDLRSAQTAMQSMQSSNLASAKESAHASQSLVRARMDIATREKLHASEHASLTARLATATAEQATAQQILGIKADPYSKQRHRYHEVLGKLDPLVRSLHRTQKAEAHILRLRTAANERSLIMDLGTTQDLDMSSITLDNIDDLADQTQVKKLSSMHKELGLSISAILKSISALVAEYFGTAPAGTVKGAQDAITQDRAWRAVIAGMRDQAPNTDAGVRYVNTVLRTLLQWPNQFYCLIISWSRVQGEYLEQTRASNWKLPSRFELIRSEGKIPVWKEHSLVLLDEGGFEYSDELKRCYATQNKLLYSLLEQCEPDAMRVAAEGSTFGRYAASQRTMYRAASTEGLNACEFFCMRMRQLTDFQVTSLDDELQSAWLLVANKKDTLQAIRNFRTLCAKGLRHHMRIKYRVVVVRTAMCLLQAHPSTLGDTLKVYLQEPDSKYIEDALPICMSMANEVEARLVGFQQMMGRGSEPSIRARFASTTGGRSQASGGGAMKAVICMEPGCKKPIPESAMTNIRKFGAKKQGITYRCEECYARKPSKPRASGNGSGFRNTATSRGRGGGGFSRNRGGGGSDRGQRGPRASGGRGGGLSRGPSYGGGGGFNGRGGGSHRGGRGGGPRHNSGRGGQRGGGGFATHHARAVTVRRHESTPHCTQYTYGIVPAEHARPQEATIAHQHETARHGEHTRGSRTGFLHNRNCYMLRVIREEESLMTSLEHNLQQPYQDLQAARACMTPLLQCRDVRCCRSSTALYHAGTQFLEVLIDTGASHSLMESSIEPFLQRVQQSDASVSGFSAEQQPTRAQCKGVANFFFMQPTPPEMAKGRPNYQPTGQYLRLTVDTMRGLAESLMSFSSLFSTAGFSLRLVNDETGKHCCIERKHPASGKQQVIPLQWDKERRGFVAYVCIGRSQALVTEVGQRAEQAMQQLSREMGRTCTLKDFGVGNELTYKYSVSAANLRTTVDELEAAMPGRVRISTQVNGAHANGRPCDATQHALQDAISPQYYFEGAPERPKGETKPGSGKQVPEAMRLRDMRENTKDNFIFSQANATHPMADKGRGRITHAAAALLSIEEPLGWSMYSGAMPLAPETGAPHPEGVELQGHLYGEADTTARHRQLHERAAAGTSPPPGSTPQNAIDVITSSSDSAGASARARTSANSRESEAHATPTRAPPRAQRRPRAMPQGLAGPIEASSERRRQNAAHDNVIVDARSRGTPAAGTSAARTQQPRGARTRRPLVRSRTRRFAAVPEDETTTESTTGAAEVVLGRSSSAAPASWCRTASMNTHMQAAAATRANSRTRAAAAPAAAHVDGEQDWPPPEPSSFSAASSTAATHGSQGAEGSGARAQAHAHTDGLSVPPTHAQEPLDPEQVADRADMVQEFLSEYDSSGIAAVRRQLPPREARMQVAELHERYGHLGGTHDTSSCALCQAMSGTFLKRAHRSRAPADPNLPGFRWSADVLFLQENATCGSRYALVMRDCCTGFYVCSYSPTKDFGSHLIQIIDRMRAKSYYQAFPYELFQEIRTDMDGSWAFEATTKAALVKRGVTLILASPSSTDDSRASAFAEAAVKFIAHTCKMILYQQRLPTNMWRLAMEQAVQLRNLFPLHKHTTHCYSGDAIRPLEQLTRGRISRSDCNQLLHCLVPVGALCLVHQSQLRGSNMATPTCRWGIAAGMLDKVCAFFDPWSGPKSARFFSKNWIHLRLPAGMGYAAALNIKQTPSNTAPARLTIPPDARDLKLKNIISIPDLASITAPARRVWSPVTSLKTGPLHEGSTPSIIMTDDNGRIYAHTEDGRIVQTSNFITAAQKQQPNMNLLDQLTRAAAGDTCMALDPHRRFDPAMLMGQPEALIGSIFWKRFDSTGLWLGTVRLYDPHTRHWTVTFRDNTYEDYDLREIQRVMVERPDDPAPTLDRTTQHGNDIVRKAMQGPDYGPLPEPLLHELRADMGECLKDKKGKRVLWQLATASDIQRALQAPDRLQREERSADSAAHARASTATGTQRYHGIDGKGARRKGVPVRNATGRTRGVNPASRTRAEETQALDGQAKRHKTAALVETPASRKHGTTRAPAAGGVIVPQDNLPWSDRLFNWQGHGLQVPTNSAGNIDVYEIDFDQWEDEGFETFEAKRGITFKDVCEMLTLDTKAAKLYFAWLGPAYGPQGFNEVGTCAARFAHPWGRGAQTLLDGQRFPKPQGLLWQKLSEQTKLKENAGNTEHVNVRVARAFMHAIAVDEKCHDNIARATVNKDALREATVYATEGVVHEVDRDAQGDQLRVLMARIGHGAKRTVEPNVAVGVGAQTVDGINRIVDPFTLKPIQNWGEDKKVHVYLTRDGLLNVKFSADKASDEAPAIKGYSSAKYRIAKVKANPNSVKRGEPIINPRTGRVMAPRTVRDIEGRPDERIWWEAIDAEMAALESMKVLIHNLTIDQIRKMGIHTSVVPLNIILTCKWTPLGAFERAKARCCVVGSPHFMKQGVHYGLTFAPTPSFEVTRLLMALCCAKGFARFQFDIKNAFATVPIQPHERVALRYPKGAERFDSQGRPLLAVMDRALYGVPDSSRKFITFLSNWIMRRFNSKGYKCHSTRSDPCLWIIRNPKGRTCYISAWCDDVQLVGMNIDDLKTITETFKEAFELKICDVQELLGVRREVKDDGKGNIEMNITQPGFIQNTYDEHKGACEALFKKPQNTPYPPRESLSRSEIPEDPAEAKRMHDRNIKRGYMSMTGSILWAARQCLPEMSYGASQLCRLMSTPTDKAYEHALHMLSYMFTQKDKGLRYSTKGNSQLMGCYDSSFKPDPKDSKCQWGYVFYFKGAPIAWASKKHDHVALSSSHAEYMALAHTARTAVWLRNLFHEMNLDEFIQGPTILLGDNINAGILCTEAKVSTQNRHILLAYHYAKEAYETGEIEPRRVDTKSNPSDVLTKANPKPDIDRLVPCLTGWGGSPPIPPPKGRE